MTSPVTGPFTKSPSSGSFTEETLVYYRQKRPYDLVLPLTHRKSTVVRLQGFGQQGVTPSRASLIAADLEPTGYDEAWNKARARWLASIGDTASLGVSLAEGRQAMSMVSARILQLVQFARAVRGLDAKKVSEALAIPQWKAHQVLIPYHQRFPKKKRIDPYGRERKLTPRDNWEWERALANLWLEFWFGWKPVVSDIQAALEVLDAPLKRVPTKGSATVQGFVLWGSDSPASEVMSHTITNRVRFGADIEITNPNLRLAQQLGLLNPAVVGLELIPWSFVFGWFVNLQDYLSSFTDFAGLTLHRSYVSRKFTVETHYSWTACRPCANPGDEQIYLSANHLTRSFIKRREPLTSVPRPVLRSSLFDLSPTRGLTSIALLLQKMPQVRT